MSIVLLAPEEIEEMKRLQARLRRKADKLKAEIEWHLSLCECQTCGDYYWAEWEYKRISRKLKGCKPKPVSIIDTSLPLTEENESVYKTIKAAIQNTRMQLLNLTLEHDRNTCPCKPCTCLRDLNPSYDALVLKLTDRKAK